MNSIRRVSKARGENGRLNDEKGKCGKEMQGSPVYARLVNRIRPFIRKENMTNQAQKNRLIKDLTKELAANNLAIFAGAGLSVESGFVNWSGLLADVATELDLDINKETDLVSLAQYHVNSNSDNRSKINSILIEEFSRNARITENHRILSRLPISIYWTTNYDDIIERSLKDTGKITDIKHDKDQLLTPVKRRDAVVYKMHGDFTIPARAVITKDDYERYHIDRGDFLAALKGYLLTTRFLFLGFSFTDPNLDYVLSRIRASYGKNQQTHDCVLKAVSQKDEEPLADFEYRKRKQELFINDLSRVGVKTLLVDDYNEITEILVEVEKSYKRKTIFISGAAASFSPFDEKNAENFIYRLSREINKRGFRIVSGFGLGVGSSVITGVLEELHMNGGSINDNQLILRPFPQSSTGSSKSIPELWTEYRKGMISYSGISIFIFGNKIDASGDVIPSNGIREEFEISKNLGNILIPIGNTGFMAKELWDEIVKDNPYKELSKGDEIFGLVKSLDGLTDLNETIKKVIDILSLI